MNPNRNFASDSSQIKLQLGSPANPVESAFSVYNQARGARDFWYWRGLKFRSRAELRIARALDSLGIMYWPNCLSRVKMPGTKDGRGNIEADFVVFYRRVGILEVDGQPWHSSDRVDYDRKRDILFKLHGIHVIKRYDADDCFQNPEKIALEFLQILEG